MEETKAKRQKVEHKKPPAKGSIDEWVNEHEKFTTVRLAFATWPPDPVFGGGGETKFFVEYDYDDGWFDRRIFWGAQVASVMMQGSPADRWEKGFLLSRDPLYGWDTWRQTGSIYKSNWMSAKLELKLRMVALLLRCVQKAEQQFLSAEAKVEDLADWEKEFISSGGLAAQLQRDKARFTFLQQALQRVVALQNRQLTAAQQSAASPWHPGQILGKDIVSNINKFLGRSRLTRRRRHALPVPRRRSAV